VNCPYVNYQIIVPTIIDQTYEVATNTPLLINFASITTDVSCTDLTYTYSITLTDGNPAPSFVTIPVPGNT
jgi:hypothetical protein